MRKSVLHPLLFGCFLWLTAPPILAQDSTAVRETDSIPIVDTVVIRTNQYPVRIVPRGVSLTNPVISFKATRPLLKKLKRFRVPSFTPPIHSTEHGMIRYLGSGLIPGIGPALAARLVKRFGPDTLDVIATQS